MKPTQRRARDARRRTWVLSGALAALLSAACASGGAAPEPAAQRPAAASPELGIDMLGSTDEAEFAALHELRADAPARLYGREQVIDVPGLRGERARMRGYLSLPAGRSAPLPGVVVIHEWWGLNDHIRHWSDRLAAEGYAVLAVDLYGGVVASDRETAMAAMQAVDADEARATLLAARRWLTDTWGGGSAPSASIGWCFGGAWSLRLAIADPELDAAVIYYGRANYTPEELAGIRARVLGIFGLEDQNPSREWVMQLFTDLKAAGVDEHVLLFPAGHAFANPSGPRYAAEPAENAWLQVRTFLRETLRR